MITEPYLEQLKTWEQTGKHILAQYGDILRRYAEQEIFEIIDMTPFVIEQRQHLNNDFEKLIIPKETLYIPNDEQAIKSVGIDRK